MYEHSFEMDVDVHHDEEDFHQLDEISLLLYFSMFVNLSDVEYYDVVMNSIEKLIQCPKRIPLPRDFHQLDQQISLNLFVHVVHP